MKKQFLFIALCVSAAALLLTGCPTNGDDDDGNGETVTITRVEDLADGLKGLPFNDADSPYTVVLKGLDIRAGWGAINDAVKKAEQYVTLDLSSCSVGREITGSQQSPAGSDFNIIRDNQYIRAVILPDTLKSIGDYAFYGCWGLTSVTIPASVTSIGDSAFSGCANLSAITVDAANTAFFVQDGVLYDKPATRIVAVPAKLAGAVTIPSGVVSVGGFGGTAITSVTIPASVTYIGMEAFSGCTNLSAITVDAANTAFFVQDGVLYNKPATRIVAVPRKLAGAVTIPNGITSIEDYAFSGCAGLTSVIIPGSVTSIGYMAFSNCTKLTSITIPASVTSIGNRAFNSCSSLTSVIIPNGVTSIGEATFYECTDLASVTIGSGVTSIGVAAFSGCTGLTSITIPDSVTSIGDYAFYYCAGLTSVTIPTNVTSIGSSAFSECAKLTSVTIPASVTTIGAGAFSGCAGMTSLTIPASLVLASSYYSGSSWFGTIVSGYESLAVVLTGNGDVASYAFYNCAGLTSVTIGSGVTSIGEAAFSGCTGLTSVTFEGSGTLVGDYNTFPYGSSLRIAGDAASNGYKMSAGTYTREPDGEVWTKQPSP